MKSYFTILSLFAAFNLIGQCPESGTITLTSQSHVDAFVADYPNCVELNNNLIIGHFGAPVSTDINNLSGLSSLKRVNGELRVRNVDLIESFEGLHNIEYVGDDLVVGDNSLLKNLSDFQNIDSIGKNLDIYSNPSLETLFEEDSLVYLGSSLSIINNNKLSKISGFKELKSIEGDLEIAGNPELNSTTGFNNLEAISGTFDIYNSPELQDLNGFENLSIIENGLEVRGTGISDFTGLNKLQQINGVLLGNSVSITDNLNLLSFNGLESLDTIQRSLFITGNEQLESITALSNLTYLGGRLSIRNSMLSDITSLNGISPLASTVEIIENPNLIKIDQLPLANAIDGSLEISDNINLLDISAVSNIDTLLGQLRVRDNISLADCISLCPLLTTGYVESIISIRNNLGDCETENEITLGCTTSAKDLNEQALFQIFPNPTKSIVNIKALNNIDEAIIFRADGSIVNLLKFDQGPLQLKLDVTDIESGLYFLELLMDKKKVIKRFIKQ